MSGRRPGRVGARGRAASLSEPGGVAVRRGRAAAGRRGSEEQGGDQDERPVLPGAHGAAAEDQAGRPARRQGRSLQPGAGRPGRVRAAQAVRSGRAAAARGHWDQLLADGPPEVHRRAGQAQATRPLLRVQADLAAPTSPRRRQSDDGKILPLPCVATVFVAKTLPSLAVLRC